MKKNRAFTLVELLVVMSITALLMAVLLPALGQAREMAKASKCLANLRAIGQCMNNYAADFKGYMTPQRTYYVPVGSYTVYPNWGAPEGWSSSTAPTVPSFLTSRGYSASYGWLPEYFIALGYSNEFQRPLKPSVGSIWGCPLAISYMTQRDGNASYSGAIGNVNSTYSFSALLMAPQDNTNGTLHKVIRNNWYGPYLIDELSSRHLVAADGEMATNAYSDGAAYLQQVAASTFLNGTAKEFWPGLVTTNFASGYVLPSGVPGTYYHPKQSPEAVFADGHASNLICQQGYTTSLIVINGFNHMNNPKVASFMTFDGQIHF